MTTQTETQAANGSAAPGTASTGSANLEALLKQFNEGTKTANDNATVVKVLEAFQPVVDHVLEEKQTKDAERVKGDVKSAIETFRKEAEIPAEVPDRFVRGFLRDVATENSEFAKAWEERGSNPTAWANALKAAKSEWQDEFKKLPKDTARSDVERAAASVRNVSTEPSKQPDFNPAEAVTWSERKWQNYLKSRGAA